MNEDQVSKFAEEIYKIVYGNVDDKKFYSQKHQEIYEWLLNGKVAEDDNIFALANEWIGYDVPEEE